MTLRRRTLSSTAILVAALFAPAWVLAEDEAPAAAPATEEAPATPPVDEGAAAAPAAPAEETVTVAPGGKQKFGEEITVTGSRIRRKDLTSPAPVTVISREQVMESGKVTLGDFLQSLPEQGNATNTNVNNGGDGSTHISLRSLGDERTLVLVNGRRMVGNAFSSELADPSPDLNAIPTSAIERVEVLKDGASAIYGSDAIAGVVNIITRKKFEGVEASALAGTSTHGDGTSYDVSITGGTSSDKGSLMFSVGYFTQAAVFANARGWSSDPLLYNFNSSNPVTPYGSSATPGGRIFLPGNPATGGALSGQNAAYNSGVANGGLGGGITPGPNGTYVPFVSGLPPKGDSFNFEPYNYLTTPSQRISLFSTGDYNLNSNVRLYYEAMLVDRRSTLYQAPEPLFALANSGLTISAQNAYNPFGVTFSPSDPTGPDVYRRMVEVGPRIDTISLDTYRLVLGMDGTLPEAAGPLKDWFWDVAVVYGRSDLSEILTGNMNVPHLQNGLGPTFVDSSGVLRCDSGKRDANGNPIAIPGCVPLNIFGGPGTFTKDMVNYVGTTLANNSFSEQMQLLVNTSGELFTIPTADRPVGLALGYELRRNRAGFTPDQLIASGESTTNPEQGTGGAFTANEGYGELQIPIVSHVPFAENLEASAAARIFNYSNFGTDWTYKLGARWSMVPDITLRGTYSTAYRAPSVLDLFEGQSASYVYINDPCAATANPTGAVLARCQAEGSTVANNKQDPNTQIRSTLGGNPKLQPETAKIYTAGLVFEPRWVRNFTLTLDYYYIDVENEISQLGDQIILDGCYRTGNPAYCSLIVRGANGQISNLYNLNYNVGFTKTDGVDIAARYVVPSPYGRFSFIFDGTWLHKYDFSLPDGTVIHARGNYDNASQGQGGVLPDFKFNAGASYGLQNFVGGVNMKYIGTIKECADSSGVLEGAGSNCYLNTGFVRDVGSYLQFDLFANYAVKSSLGKTTLGAGVNNVFNVSPPNIFGGFTAATDPTGGYDFLGRYFWVRLTQDI